MGIMSFEEYIKEHLASFIAFELEKGYPIASIKNVLVRKGHDENLIDAAIDHLVKSGYVPRVRKNKPYKTLEKEIFENLVKSIADYIAIQIENGYNLDEIKKTLLDFGHSQDVIEEALAKIKGHRRIYEKHEVKSQKRRYQVFPFVLSFLILLIAIISISTGDVIYIIALGFLPCIISVVLVESIYNDIKNKYALLLIPVAVTLLFFLLVSSFKSDVFSHLASTNLMLLNLLIGVVAALLYIKK